MRAPRECRPLGKCKRPNSAGIHVPNNQLAEGLVACLRLAREGQEVALGREMSIEARAWLLSLEDRMDARIHELTGVRYHVPDGKLK